jgi:hypothetical protein
MPLFAEAAEFAAKIANNRTGFRNFSPDVITLFFDEACKLVELGLLFLWHAGQYYRCDKPAGAGIEFTKWRGLAGVGFAKLISRLAGALPILLQQGSSPGGMRYSMTAPGASAGAVARARDLHPLENAAFPRHTPFAGPPVSR